MYCLAESKCPVSCIKDSVDDDDGGGDVDGDDDNGGDGHLLWIIPEHS